MEPQRVLVRGSRARGARLRKRAAGVGPRRRLNAARRGRRTAPFGQASDLLLELLAGLGERCLGARRPCSPTPLCPPR
eukprot:9389552-Pyramimonas_sp.AAC.1